MKKIMTVENCNCCSFFEVDPQDIDHAWGKSYCHKTGQILKEIKEKWEIPIPENCPLETYIEPEQFSFDSEEKYTVVGRGEVYITVLDRDCTDFKWLRGQKVRVNFKDISFTATVNGVESFGSPVKRKGSIIGLLLSCKEII